MWTRATLSDIGNRWLPQTTYADCAEGSGAFLPPSPPAEKATTSKDQAGKSSTDDGEQPYDVEKTLRLLGYEVTVRYDVTEG